MKIVTVRLSDEQYALLVSDANKNLRSIGGQIRFDLFGDRCDVGGDSDDC